MIGIGNVVRHRRKCYNLLFATELMLNDRTFPLYFPLTRFFFESLDSNTPELFISPCHCGYQGGK